MSTLPNCLYCGQYVNPRSPGIKCAPVYGSFEIDRVEYWHEGCEPEALPDWVKKAAEQFNPTYCHADRDGECSFASCPQQQPNVTPARTCPLWTREEDERD